VDKSTAERWVYVYKLTRNVELALECNTVFVFDIMEFFSTARGGQKMALNGYLYTKKVTKKNRP